MTKEEEAIEKCKKIIQQNKEIVKQARLSKDINAIELTANCDDESTAIETVLNMLKEKDTEIEKKDKIIDLRNKELRIKEDELKFSDEKIIKLHKMIDLMAEEIYLLHTSLIEEYGDYKTQFSENGEEVSKENIKQYYDRESRG